MADPIIIRSRPFQSLRARHPSGLLAGPADGPAAADYQGAAVTIAIVDYGVGNLTSVKKAFDRVSGDAVVTSDPERGPAGKIILPGVGHFSSTRNLDHHGLRSAIDGSIRAECRFLESAWACSG
jgi:hypothetical protein